LSAAIAGLAGGIYTFYLGYLAPGSFPVMLSIQYVVMAAVGGMGTVSGGVVGSVLVLLTVDALSRVATMSGMPSVAPIIASYAVYAVLLVTAVLFVPEGLVPFCSRLWSRRASTRGPSPRPSSSPSRSDAPAESASVPP
jgi:branched-chain amino acid transport system permease protein